jgi:hypothetical protein
MTFQYSIRWQNMDPENAGEDGEYRDIELEDYLATREARSGSGSEASRPSGLGGDWFYATDTSRLFWNDGTGWIIMSEPEQSYTPSWVNVTPGTGFLTPGTYRRSNGMLDLHILMTLGTGGALTGQPTVALPSGITSGVAPRGTLAVGSVNTGVLRTEGLCESLSAGNTVLTPYVGLTSGTYLAQTNITGTVPFTWAVGDQIEIVGRIPMQTRYL